MKPFPRSLPLVAALVAVALAPLTARADDRLAGYWVPAQGEAATAAFSFGILGRWTIVAPRWDGSTPGLKVRYVTATAGSGGTLTADEKLDQHPDAPRTITYELTGGELFLSVPDTEHAGKYHLVKGVPPASAPASAPADTSAPAPAPAPPPPRNFPAPARDPNALIGNWSTEPGGSIQVSLFITPSKTASAKINQQWIRGSDAPVVSRAGDYTATFVEGRGTLTKSRQDYEGSEIPMHLDYVLEGDVLTITVSEGTFAGEYRLLRAKKGN